MRAGKTRPKPTKKRRLCAINAHFEEDFNAVLPSAIVLGIRPTRDGRIAVDHKVGEAIFKKG
jgi:hypothetical protein